MSQFYVVEARSRAPRAAVSLLSNVPSSPWMTGKLVADPGEVIVYGVDREYPGNLSPFYWSLQVPLIRHDLLDALKSAGVDNIQTFAAVLRDTAAGKEHTDYSALNILGLVSAADLSKSTLMRGESLTGVDRDFHKLVIDESAVPPDFLMFRLAESVNAIIVHEKVKAVIESRNIAGMIFYDQGEWSG
jgi:hypothetical protein